MQNKNLLIVFAKNIVLGKVKTRLAATVGDNAAFDVYKCLIEITELETLKMQNCDVHIYFSDVVINSLWPNNEKYVQQGNDLGQRMMHAFKNSFENGYRKVIGVGTDLPDLNAEIMQEAFQALEQKDCVFGPSEDGGYYLLGMKNLIPEIFIDKPWSTDKLLEVTLENLKNIQYTSQILEVLNDVDNIEDLRSSSLANRFSHLLNQ